jgi:uncharacterized membrane protein YgcG
LNVRLAQLEKKTSVEIAVVTVSSLNGQDVETYTRGLATAWRVGKSGENNGVVFLVAPKERKMRIQTASGSRSVLTDSMADGIRDRFILPQFRRGDMAAGIVDGTSEIIRVFDEEPTEARDRNVVSSQLDREIQPAPQATSQPDSSSQRTAEDTKTLELVGAGILFIALLLILIVPPIRRSRARDYVMAEKASFPGRLTNAEGIAVNADVKDETREKLSTIKGDFSPISRLTINSDHVDWIESRDKLETLSDQLDSVIATMKEEIAYAEEAREEGPKLMEKLPDLIAATEKKIAAGETSEKEAGYLAEARQQYARAQSAQQSEGMNWIFIYELLNSAHSNCESAQEAHVYANTDHSSMYSASAESGTGVGFGGSDSDGFGGGGGFSGGGSAGGSDSGGGSTGSW